MSKLTLTVDDRVVSSAKRYAKQRGLSVSEMVEAYLAAVANTASAAALLAMAACSHVSGLQITPLADGLNMDRNVILHMREATDVLQAD